MLENVMIVLALAGQVSYNRRRNVQNIENSFFCKKKMVYFAKEHWQNDGGGITT